METTEPKTSNTEAVMQTATNVLQNQTPILMQNSLISLKSELSNQWKLSKSKRDNKRIAELKKLISSEKSILRFKTVRKIQKTSVELNTKNQRDKSALKKKRKNKLMTGDYRQRRSDNAKHKTTGNYTPNSKYQVSMKEKKEKKKQEKKILKFKGFRIYSDKNLFAEQQSKSAKKVKGN